MKKTLEKVGKVLGLILSVLIISMIGGISSYLVMNTVSGIDDRLCRAESLNDCLMIGNKVPFCMREASTNCD